ncbi:MAG: hypothetical protein ACLFPQ_04600 [Candidatus Woesearchaeota archaeon]
MKCEFSFDKADFGSVIDSHSEINFLVSKDQFASILSDINNKLDEDEFIPYSSNDEREIAKDGDEIRVDRLGGIMTGSKVFIKKNIASFSEHLIDLKSRRKVK